jgi:hypothetical protein
MKTRANGTQFVEVLLVTMVCGATASGQVPSQHHLPGQRAGDVPRPNPKGTDPKPEDATTAILTAFD